MIIQSKKVWIADQFTPAQLELLKKYILTMKKKLRKIMEI